VFYIYHFNSVFSIVHFVRRHRKLWWYDDTICDCHQALWCDTGHKAVTRCS